MGKATGVFLILAGVGTAALVLPAVDKDAERQLAEVVRIATGGAAQPSTSIPSAPVASTPSTSTVSAPSSIAPAASCCGGWVSGTVMPAPPQILTA